MKKIGITGQSGFIGSHLYNTLKLDCDNYQIIEFHRDNFHVEAALDAFVKECDIIVHLAGVNRHVNDTVIYQANIDLATKLAEAIKRTGSFAHVIFSSSIQEERDNIYGNAKKAARVLLAEAAKTNGTGFTGLIIPNVFGPFGNPYYNSVIATFCHQLTHSEEPKINVDGELKLIYVAELVDVIISCFANEPKDEIIVQHTSQVKVSYILNILKGFKKDYFDKGIIPLLNHSFELNLFNTFRSYIDLKNYFPFQLKKNEDNRGVFVELVRLNIGGQVSFSTTLPGIIRGNHYHTRKIERFAVVKGKAKIQLRKVGTNEVLDFYLDGSEPGYVDMPVWYTHNITNIGHEELLTVFWINEFYDANDSDTYMENV